MNPDPHVYGVSTVRHGCGKLAMQNVIRAFWQSRDPEHRLPQLTDIPQLAKDIRRASTSATPTAARAAAPLTVADICEAFGVTDARAAYRTACYKALQGDGSDGLPGTPGHAVVHQGGATAGEGR